MRNETTLAALERELQANCGDDLMAARAVGVSLLFVNQWKKDDEVVAKRLAEAERVGVQGLQSEAIRRAVRGVTKGVYYKGVRVDEEVVYSDGLLQTLLKAKLTDFKGDGEGGNQVNVNVNVANVMPRASSYEQWLEMKTKTLAPKVEALPPPDESEVIEAEYVEVPAPAYDFGGIVL